MVQKKYQDMQVCFVRFQDNRHEVFGRPERLQPNSNCWIKRTHLATIEGRLETQFHGTNRRNFIVGMISFVRDLPDLTIDFHFKRESFCGQSEKFANMTPEDRVAKLIRIGFPIAVRPQAQHGCFSYEPKC